MPEQYFLFSIQKEQIFMNKKNNNNLTFETLKIDLIFSLN
jgi:hypothetical protein